MRLLRAALFTGLATVVAATPGVLGAPRLAAAAGDMTAADLLDKARAAVDAVDYDAARDLVDDALEQGGLAVGELARAHRFAGEIAAALGDSNGARAHFVRWILLDPSAALAPGVSPKIENAFAEAKAEAARLGGFSMTAKLARPAGKVHVTIVARDPLKLASRLQARVGDGEPIVLDGREGDLPAEDTAPVVIHLDAFDKHGNQLWTTTVRAEPTVKPVTRGYPAWVRWPTWAGVAAVSAGTAGFFAWQTSRAEDELAALNADSVMHTFDEARAIQERGERNAMIANVALGFTVAAAAAAVLTYVLEPSGVELRPIASPEGAGVSAGIRF